MKRNRFFVFIRDQENCPEYMYGAFAPLGMSKEKAEGIVDLAIRKVKEADPREYQFLQLEEELTRLGFEVPLYAEASERW